AARAELVRRREERIADGAHADEDERRFAERDLVEDVVTSTRDGAVFAKRAAERERSAIGESAIGVGRHRRMRGIGPMLESRLAADERVHGFLLRNADRGDRAPRGSVDASER